MKQSVNIHKSNYYRLIGLASLILLSVTSCKKYLDKKSDTRLTTIDRLEDLQAMLDRPDRQNFRVVPVSGEVSSDDYFSFNPGNGVGQEGELAYKWQYFSTLYGGNPDWRQNYFPANIANICLEEIEKFPKTVDNTLQWDNIKGSALFFRAFYFLNLTWIYGKAYDSVTSVSDLGIALRLTIDDHVPIGPTVRATVSQSYDQVIKDAKESIGYLPDIALHPLRPSKAAAYGLLARAYLSMRMYDSAFKYADLSLAIRSELMDYNGDGDIVNSFDGTNSPFRLYNKETIFYAGMNANPLHNLLVYGNMDTLLYASYADNDLRKMAFFTPDSINYPTFKGNYTQEAYRKFGGIATDEMYLVRAECYARKGMVSKAMDDLNALIIKRWKNNGSWIPFAAADATDALNKILEERRKELVFRGLRWPDIKRLNKENAAITLRREVDGHIFELLPNSNKYALPIPEDIIQLTGIPQNPGWL